MEESSKREELAEKVRQLPHKPGVYLFRDRFGRVIYVGKARDLHKRVSQYFHPSRRANADLKTRALVESVRDLETHVVRSEAESLILEGRLIKQFRPRYNISFRDDKQFLLVKVNMNEPFPQFHLTRLRKDDGCRYFGPFVHSSALRSTLNLMKKKFHLRSCRPVEPGEKDFRHCLDHIIKQCSAPCVARISREGYLENVRQACSFLEGKSAEMLESLEKEMQRAAEQLDFEKAAKLRNMLSDIRSTTAPRRSFVRELPTTVVPEQDLRALQEALGLPVPPETIECFDISNISDTHKVASMVVFRKGRAATSDYRRYRIKEVKGQDDFASMAEVIRRRYRRVLAESGRMPDLIVVDGGKGQLGAALRELEALGCADQTIIGLAKQREEIFRPGDSRPLVLPLESRAIRLLQRVRDEAHRIANGYHQLLLKRRVSESVLDDCPGVSEMKKKALLKHFGSVDKVRRAAVEELREVEGIGPKLAAGIRAFFDRRVEESKPSGEAPKPETPGEVTYVLRRG